MVKFVHSRQLTKTPRLIAASSDGHLHLYSRHAASTSGWKLTKSWALTGSAPPQKAGPFAGKRPKPVDSVSVRALGVLRPAAPWSLDKDSDGQDEDMVVSASSDGTMKVWAVNAQGDVKLKQTATLGRARAESNTEVLPLDISLASLPLLPEKLQPSPLLMAVAGTDGKVDLWLSEGSQPFKRLFSLTGHSDWVRSLDFCQIQSAVTPTLMLATGAQDGTVRLWKVQQSAAAQHGAAKTLDEFERLAAQIEDDVEEETIATKAQAFQSGNARWDVSFDALLTGHEHWVTGTRWAPLDGERQPAALLSSSADNSVILWTPASSVTEAISNTVLPSFPPPPVGEDAEEQDVWVSVQRFGELGNVGSAANGMYGALWDPSMSSSSSSQMALGHGYGGAVHLWRRQLRGGHLGQWKAQAGLGGHFAPSTCVRWEPRGQYLISGGLDKTTRLHGCFKEPHGQSWHELARPQTHGFEIVSLAWLSRLAFASAGDEKIIRVFEAPKGFVQTMQSLDCAAGGINCALSFRLPSIGHLVDASHLEGPIKEATRRTISTNGRLTIAAVSPLFDGASDGERPRLSFGQAESFLKWCYSMTWMEAIKAKKLLFEVDVLLVGDDRAAEVVEGLADGPLFTVDEPSCALTFVKGSASLLASHAARPLETGEDVARLPQYRVIALGGTFDHLHVGHKILLSMAALCATSKIIVGVTDDSMLTKKKSAHLLEDIDVRIKRVSTFLATFRRPMYDLERDVVKLQDVAGPAGTVADIDALLFTDETVSGADFIDKEREKNGLNKLERLSIGVIGAQGETDLSSTEASELAAAKVGSTAIRQWLDKEEPLDMVATLSGEERPVGASVPPLGLSNRSIFSTSGLEDGPSETGQPLGKAQQSIASHLTRPPVEEGLHNNSLWCEVTKLYGHALELLAIDVDLASGLIASSCKGKSDQTAGIRIHDRRQTWREIQVLHGHLLDVTKVRFSPDGAFLVSVSRDRTWRLFRKDKDGLFGLVATEEAHTRIIYDVAWSLNSTLFATASRDNSIKVWSTTGSDDTKLLFAMSLKNPLTALAFTAKDRLAVGDERGNVTIFDCTGFPQNVALHERCSIPALHSEAVSELAWKPGEDESREQTLASSSLDGTVRVCRISE